MSIQINDQLTIGEVQNKFTAAFPFLRLAFFQPASNPLINDFKNELSPTEKLATQLKEGKDAIIEITSLNKVSEVEQAFRNQYALEAQVMRRSGNNWLMTTTTDDYTLGQQNSLGIEMSTTVENPDPEDIHEQQ